MELHWWSDLRFTLKYKFWFISMTDLSLSIEEMSFIYSDDYCSESDKLVQINDVPVKTEWNKCYFYNARELTLQPTWKLLLVIIERVFVVLENTIHTWKKSRFSDFCFKLNGAILTSFCANFRIHFQERDLSYWWLIALVMLLLISKKITSRNW